MKKKIISGLVVMALFLLPTALATETYGLSESEATLYLEVLEPMQAQHSYTYSSLVDFTGDGKSELYLAYGTSASAAKEGIWTIENGKLVELSDAAKYVGASYLGTGENGKAYILYELTADSSVSGGMFYRIVGYENGTFGLVYELIRSDTFAFNPDTLYDYNSPISYYSENGVHEDELHYSGSELYENMLIKYGFSTEKEYTRGDDYGGALPSSSQETVYQILTELSTTVAPPEVLPEEEGSGEYESDNNISEQQLQYAMLKAGLPYNGDGEMKLSEAQIKAFISVLEQNHSQYQSWIGEQVDMSILYSLYQGEDKFSLNPGVYVAFFDIGDGVVGMMVENILYIWTVDEGILTHSKDEFTDYSGEVYFYSFGEGGHLHFGSSITGGTYYVSLFEVKIYQGRLYRTDLDTYFWDHRPNEGFNEFLQKQVIRGSNVDLGADILSFGKSIPDNLVMIQVENGELVQEPFWDGKDEVRLGFYHDLGMNVYWGNIKEYQEVLEILYRLSESVEEYFGFPSAEEEVQEASKTLIPRVKKVFHLKKELYYAVVEEEQGDQGAVITYIEGECDFYEEIAPLKTQAELVLISQNFLSLSDLVAADSVDSSVETQESFVETSEIPNTADHSPLTTVIITVLVLVLLLIFVMALLGLLLRKKKS